MGIKKKSIGDYEIISDGYTITVEEDFEIDISKLRQECEVFKKLVSFCHIDLPEKELSDFFLTMPSDGDSGDL